MYPSTTSTTQVMDKIQQYLFDQTNTPNMPQESQVTNVTVGKSRQIMSKPKTRRKHTRMHGKLAR